MRRMPRVRCHMVLRFFTVSGNDYSYVLKVCERLLPFFFLLPRLSARVLFLYVCVRLSSLSRVYVCEWRRERVSLCMVDKRTFDSISVYLITARSLSEIQKINLLILGILSVICFGFFFIYSLN